MGNTRLFFLLPPMLLILASCAVPYKPEELPPSIRVGSLYYTQFTLQHEKNRFRTTNYRKGVVLPVNSAVRLVSIDSKKILVRVMPTGPELIVENVPKYTKDDTIGAFGKIFSQTRKDLGRFSSAERKNIELGHVEEGMSKDAVIAAIGFPPSHETPSLDSDQWKYWANRFNTFIVHFDRGRVVRVQQ